MSASRSLLLALSLLLPMQAWAQTTATSASDKATQYRIQKGDVIEFSVVGIPDLRQKIAVDVDGVVSLPVIGRIHVEGLTIPEMQATVAEHATQRPVRRRADDGREVFSVLTQSEINAVLTDYRPIYVLGDVQKAGEVAYKPEMTAQQAIALAGGYDVARYRLVNPFIEAADFRGVREMRQADLTKVLVRIARIRAELDGKNEIDTTSLMKTLPDDALLKDAIAVESDQLKLRLQTVQNERNHLTKTRERLQGMLETLNEQFTALSEGLKADNEESEQIREFAKKGSVPLSRLMDLRRVQVQSTTRVNETIVLIQKAKQDLAEAERNQQRFEDNRRADLLRDLQDAQTDVAKLKSEIFAVSEKVFQTTALRSQLTRAYASEVRIRVTRANPEGKSNVEFVTPSAVLHPGDTVDVELVTELDQKPPVR